MKDVYNTKSGRTTVRPDIHQSFIHLSPAVGGKRASFISHPFNHLAERWLLAVHQYAHAVDLACHPYQGEGGGVEHDERQHGLPYGSAER